MHVLRTAYLNRDIVKQEVCKLSDAIYELCAYASLQLYATISGRLRRWDLFGNTFISE